MACERERTRGTPTWGALARASSPDGTLIERQQDWLVPGADSPTPQRSVITGFSTDGVTIIRIIDIDYRAAQFAASGQPVGGTVISTRFEGGIRASTTNISY